jgi:chromosome segregation ATPase
MNTLKTPENQESVLKSYLMKIIVSFKEDINNSLKEIQENTGKQVKELNKSIQDLKVEVETIKKRQMEANLEIENLEKRSRITDVSITNRIQEIEERISGVEDTVEEIDTAVKENSKHKKKKNPNPKHPGISGHNEQTKSKNSQNRAG